jgi:hypothetical protein
MIPKILTTNCPFLFTIPYLLSLDGVNKQTAIVYNTP